MARRFHAFEPQINVGIRICEQLHATLPTFQRKMGNRSFQRGHWATFKAFELDAIRKFE
jgi:hypothetical protein